MNAISINFSEFIQIQNNQTITTSEFIAQAFGKQHKNVLAKIEEIAKEIKADFFELNFKPKAKQVKTGFGCRETKSYELTKDGFMLLVMGFTGKAAMQIKIAYIEAFNAMAEKLFPTEKLSPQQKQQIQAAVNRRVHRTGETHQAIYTAIHELAQVASYHDIAATDFDNVMNFINGEKVSGSLNKPLPQEYFTHLAKMTRYASKLWQFQDMMCQSPNSKQAKTILNEMAYSTNVNETGFLFIFKPNLKDDIQQAIDWLHAQSQVI